MYVVVYIHKNALLLLMYHVFTYGAKNAEYMATNRYFADISYGGAAPVRARM